MLSTWITLACSSNLHQRAATAGCTRLASAHFSSSSPEPVTAEMAWNSSFLRLACAASFFSFSGFAASILVATTIIGLSASGCSPAPILRREPKLASSLLITLKSSTGSGRPDASDTSTRCASTRVRSMCLRNCTPSPCPRCAPSMSPGTSATTNDCCSGSSPTVTTPRFGSSVVNG